MRWPPCLRKATAVAPLRLSPKMATVVPPAAGPEVVSSPVMSGVSKKVYSSLPLITDVPAELVTVMLTVPAARTGARASISESDAIVNDLAAFPPKVTAVVPVKLAPRIWTAVPPAVGPCRDVGSFQRVAMRWHGRGRDGFLRSPRDCVSAAKGYGRVTT
jgi:hypothetical protein